MLNDNLNIDNGIRGEFYYDCLWVFGNLREFVIGNRGQIKQMLLCDYTLKDIKSIYTERKKVFT